MMQVCIHFRVLQCVHLENLSYDIYIHNLHLFKAKGFEIILLTRNFIVYTVVMY